MKPEPPKTVTMRAAMIDLDADEPALPRTPPRLQI
jgi:hypothetical protein